ncbi:Eco57I restriction-modification methylase domain-containing protein [Paenibacillus larvae]|uniref:Eco57I restriction-modification methylase domain-containing protein n=1 Tax=Paenibacillus larvae TaxID=1464 RepID=UPI00289005EF|nr:N-6 DNA methylase [Paenibacillus larvae]MDT2230694.1 N-6 DNA methylase [Paenibacillus larvae]
MGNALDHDRRDYYDLVIGNPPYGETVETEKEYLTLSKKKGIYRGKSEAAFIELAIRAARPGGYIAFILPTGISFAGHAKKVRKLMYETSLAGRYYHAAGRNVYAHGHDNPDVKPSSYVRRRRARR